MKKELWDELSDEQSEKVVGGVGAGTSGGNSAGFDGWNGNGNRADGDQGLFGAGQGFGPTVVTHGANDTSVVHPK